MARRTADSPLPLSDLPKRPDYAQETALAGAGFRHVAGLDEVGRGPLAGPVAAAAVILDPHNLPEGLDDSKRLTAARRKALFAVILETSIAVSVVSLSATATDRTDIRQASLEAMRRALHGLTIRADFALADGRDVPPGLSCPAHALIKGDRRSMSIAAASIVAKVVRDRMMTRVCATHPAYGFSSNAGYPTVHHRDVLEAAGPVARLHRMSFAPLRRK